MPTEISSSQWTRSPPIATVLLRRPAASSRTKRWCGIWAGNVNKDTRCQEQQWLIHSLKIPAPAALGGYYDSNNYDCNQDSNNVGYMGPDSRPSILAGEEWKVSSSRRVSQSKPLPQEPPMPPPRSSLFMDNNNYFYERQHPYQAIQQQYQPPSAYHDESSLYQETEEKPASVKSTKSTESVKKSGKVTNNKRQWFN